MDADKLKDIVKAAVDASLSEKERAVALAAMEDIIAEAKTKSEELATLVEAKSEELASKDAELASAVEEKEAVVANLSDVTSKLEEAQAKIENLEADVSAKIADLEAAEVAFAEVSAKFTELDEKAKAAEKAARLADRLSKLEEAKVLRSTEEAAEKQRALVEGLEDEAFEEYLTDMVALKQEFSAVVEDDETGADDTNHEEGSLNFESDNDTLSEKYKKLGEAMAKL